MNVLANPSSSPFPGSRVGRVVSLSPDGTTASIEIDTVIQHKKYLKRLRRVVSLKAHVKTGDQALKVQPKDHVRIIPCRRISKTKSWLVVQVERVL